MPLTADWTRIADYDKVDTVLRDTLTISTVNIGIGEWTEANAPEVYARLHLLEDVYGPFLYHVEDGVRSERSITPEDVRRFIGLRTNVGKTETRASFIKRHVTHRLDDAVWAYNRAQRAAKDSDAA